MLHIQVQLTKTALAGANNQLFEEHMLIYSGVRLFQLNAMACDWRNLSL